MTIFKSSANWFAATLGPEVFLENFLRERASKPTWLADNELRERGFLSLSFVAALGSLRQGVVRRQLTRSSVHFRE